jgi:DNA-binding transcriptional regulator LsrR (DeoR family)
MDLDQLQSLLQRARGNRAAHSKPTQTKIRNIARRLGHDKIDRLVTEYQEGRTTIELMGRYGLSKASVIHLLEANGVALRRQRLSEHQAAEAAWLYKQGHSLSAITEQLQLPRESIRRALVDAGVAMRPRGGSKRRS